MIKTAGVNFTNILHAAFPCESLVQSFFVFEVKAKLFIDARKLAQLRSKNVGEIDSKMIGAFKLYFV